MPEAVNAETLRKSLAELKPPAVAFSDWNFKPELVTMAREAGCEVFLDRQGKTDFPQYWSAAIEAGATGIQTDRPADAAGRYQCGCGVKLEPNLWGGWLMGRLCHLALVKARWAFCPPPSLGEVMVQCNISIKVLIYLQSLVW